MTARDPAPPASPQCPSEAVLDAYTLGELEDATQRAHVVGCAYCQHRLRAREEDFSAMPGRAEMIRAVHVAVAEAEVPRRRWRWAAVASAFAVPMVALFAVVRMAPETEGVRPKGAAALSVYVQRDGRAARAWSGGVFHPGERLRFEIDLAEPAEVMIVGREASGRIYEVFPVASTPASSQAFLQGADQLLPGAVVLDETLGRETLFLVTCKGNFDSSQITGTEAGLRAPPGCLTTPFVLEKIRR